MVCRPIPSLVVLVVLIFGPLAAVASTRLPAAPADVAPTGQMAPGAQGIADRIAAAFAAD
jgi:hypothetical protein